METLLEYYKHEGGHDGKKMKKDDQVLRDIVHHSNGIKLLNWEEADAVWFSTCTMLERSQQLNFYMDLKSMHSKRIVPERAAVLGQIWCRIVEIQVYLASPTHVSQNNEKLRKWMTKAYDCVRLYRRSLDQNRARSLHAVFQEMTKKVLDYCNNYKATELRGLIQMWNGESERSCDGHALHGLQCEA